MNTYASREVFFAGARAHPRVARRLFVTLVSLSAIVGLSPIRPASAAPPAVGLEQCRTGEATTPNDCQTFGGGSVGWVNGNAGPENSHFAEGYSIPYRAILTDLPTDGTVIALDLGYDIKHGGGHALDFLTHYQRLEPHLMWGHPAETVFPTDGVSGVGAPTTTFAIPAPSSAGSPVSGQPTTAFNSLPAGEKLMTLFGGTITNVAYVSQGSLADDNSESVVRVTFTAASATAVLSWGGHIAKTSDWGEGNAASAISGSPYHMRAVNWNLNNLGSQDRSLKSEAVIAPGKIIVEKQTVPDGSSQSFEFNPSWSTTNFFLTDGQTNDSGDLLPGEYSVSEIVPSGWSLDTANCSDGSPRSAIDLDEGETVTCVFTNTGQPNLALVKSVDTDLDGDFDDNEPEVQVGDTVNYKIAISNTGTGNGSVPSVVDDYTQAHIDPEAIASMTPAASSDDGDKITWSGPIAVNAGQTKTFEYSAVVIGTFSGTPPQGPCDEANQEYAVPNTASAGTLQDDAVVCVEARPDLDLEKEVDTDLDGDYDDNEPEVQVGDTVRYRITLSNDGDANGSVPSVVDDYEQTHIDPEAIASMTPAASTDDGDKITWNGPIAVNAGQSKTYIYEAVVIGTFSGTPPQGPCDEANQEYSVPNTASAGTLSDDAVVCVEARPDLALVKSVDTDLDGDFDDNEPEVQVGDTVNYKVTLSNSGDANATVPSVVDDYTQAHIDPEAIASMTPAASSDDGDKITWSGPIAVNAGQTKTFEYSSTVIGTFSGTPPTGPCDEGNQEYSVPNTASAGTLSDDAVVCVEARPDLDLVKSVDTDLDGDFDDSEPSVGIGDTVHYRITLSNDGDANGSVPSVVDDYEETHINPEPIDEMDPDATSDLGGEITWDGPIAVAAKDSVTFEYAATVIGTFSGAPPQGPCAETNQEYAVPNTASAGTLSDDAVVCVVPEPDLDLTKEVDTDLDGDFGDNEPKVEPGDTVRYRITLGNTGTGPGSVPSVVDDYDEANLDPEAVADMLPVATIDDGDVITWPGVTVDPGDSATFVYEATVLDGPDGTLGEGGCDETDSFPAINLVGAGDLTATSTVCIAVPPTITVDKTAAPASLPEPGGTFTFTVVVTNTSSEVLTVTELTDDIYGDLVGNGDCAVGAELDPGETYTCSFDGAFAGTSGDAQTDVVTATAEDDDENEATDSDDATVTLTPAPLGTIVIAKQTTPDGSPVEFTFTGNVSGLISDGETLTARLPAGAYTVTEAQLDGWRLGSIACSDGNSTGNVGTRTATIDLGPGETVTCTFNNAAVVAVAPQVVTKLPATGAHIMAMIAAALALIAVGLQLIDSRRRVELARARRRR